jgi:hypothetical protein
MTCINRDTIQQYIDNEVSSSEKVRIMRHIATCNRCATDVDQAKQMKKDICSALHIDTDINIPVFTAPDIKVKRNTFNIKRILYVAAVILFITSLSVVVSVSHTNNNNITPDIDLMQNYEYDANKSIFDTEITVIVTDNEGNSTAYSIE